MQYWTLARFWCHSLARGGGWAYGTGHIYLGSSREQSRLIGSMVPGKCKTMTESHYVYTLCAALPAATHKSRQQAKTVHMHKQRPPTTSTGTKSRQQIQATEGA